MNDIKLVSENKAFWDIAFEDGDLKTISDEDEVLNNDFIIALLTQQGEMNSNPTYNDFGSEIYKLVKDNQSELNRARLKAYIKKALENMDRIKEVTSINLDKSPILCTCTKANNEIITYELRI